MFFMIKVYERPDFSGSRFFWVQVFLGPGFPESRIFWVQVFQGPGPVFTSSHFEVYQIKKMMYFWLNYCNNNHHIE